MSIHGTIGQIFDLALLGIGDVLEYPTGHITLDQFKATPVTYLAREGSWDEVSPDEATAYSITATDSVTGKSIHIVDASSYDDAKVLVRLFKLLDGLTREPEEPSPAESMIDDFNQAIMKPKHPYHVVAGTLLEAFEQTAHGKGQVRHNVTGDKAFQDQDMLSISECLESEDGIHYQVFKKLKESRSLDYNHMRAERLGAIIYIVGSLVYQDKQGGHL